MDKGYTLTAVDQHEYWPALSKSKSIIAAPCPFMLDNAGTNTNTLYQLSYRMYIIGSNQLISLRTTEQI